MEHPIVLKKEEISQTLNLDKIFNADLSERTDLKARIAQEAIDIILNRTKSSKDIHGSRFDSYDEDYKESFDFKVAGKSNKVNMELSGGMMADLGVINIEGNEIKIGFRDETEKLKAFNHNTGDTVPKREFFGLNDKEVRKIKSKFKNEVKSIQNTVVRNNQNTLGELLGVTPQEQNLLNRTIASIFGGLFGDN